MENSWLITYLLGIPLAGAIIMLFFKEEKENLIRWFGLVVSLAAFVVSLVMYVQFDPANSQFQLTQYSGSKNLPFAKMVFLFTMPPT